MNRLACQIKLYQIGYMIFLMLFPLFLFGQKSEVFDDSLSVRHCNIKEVVVHSSFTKRNNSFSFTPMDVKKLVTVLGEPDVLRFISTLPGVSQGMEGSLGLFIRGGNSGNSRVELDGVPVYGSSHLFGFTSSFHPEMVKNVDFKTGGLPSSSGDLLSSLTQISSRTIDSVGVRKTFSMSPFLTSVYLSSKKTPQSPFSYQVAARYSLLQSICISASALFKNLEVNMNPLIADVFFKGEYTLNKLNHFQLSTYLSEDNLGVKNEDLTMNMYWSNKIVRLGWNHYLTDNGKYRLNTVYYYNNFQSGQGQETWSSDTLANELIINTSIVEHDVKSVFQGNIRNFNMQAGVEAKIQKYSPGGKVLSTSTSDNVINGNEYTPFSAFIFGDVSYTGSKLVSVLGFRETYYQLEGESHIMTDIHANAQYFIQRETGIELSYDKLNQLHHVIEGLPTGWALDLIIPSMNGYKHEEANQFYCGSFWKNDIFTLATGVYYKTMNNLLTYQNASDVFNVDNSSWETDVVSGNGTSYGLETHVEFVFGKMSGALSYTLSKSDRQFDDLNGGLSFPAKFDRRHILNSQLQLKTIEKKKQKQHLDIILAFLSGNHATIPIGTYDGVLPPFWGNSGGNSRSSEMNKQAWYRQQMSEVNAYQMANYFRVDVGYSFVNTKENSEREIRLGIYNITNRKNPYLVFYDESRWKQLSIVPILPSISYTLKF